MKKRAAALAISFAALACITAKAQTVGEVIKKNIDARGGIEKLKAIKSIRATGKIVQGGLEIPIVILQKRPSSFRFDVTFQGKSQTQAFDGRTGWKVDAFQGSSEPEKMTADELKQAEEQADPDGPLVDYKDKGHTVELLGKEDVEGTAAYKLKVTLKGGDVRYVWLDAGNYLDIKGSAKRKTSAGEMEFETFPGNYKEVAGTLVAFSTEIKNKGQTIYTLVLDKVEPGVALDDSLFKMPEKAPEKPKTN